MRRGNVVVVAFNAKLVDGCDYALQTLRIVGVKNHVYGLLLGEPIGWKDIFRTNHCIVSSAYGCTLVRPFFIIPGQRWQHVRACNYFLNALLLRVWIRLRHGRSKKILWFFETWNMLAVYHALRGYHTIYDCVDYYLQLGYESFAPVLYLLRHADIVTCISPELAKAYGSVRHDIHIVPSGFATLPVLKTKHAHTHKSDRFTVGYIGGINYRLHYPLLLRVIRALPDIKFIFIGPIQKYLIRDESRMYAYLPKIFSLSNVSYIGAVHKHDIRGYLRSFDVGIIPYDLSHRFNKYCFPMKLMEFFSVGLPVISTPIPSLAQFTNHMALRSTAASWIREIRLLQADDRRSSFTRRVKSLVAAHTWEKKISVIRALLSDRIGRGSL